MGTYNSAVITTAGQSLLARAIADNLPFYFTSAKTTEYVVSTGTSAASLTELPNIKQSEEITSATVSGGNQVATSVRFDNTEITLNYSINTIGVYARVGTDTEETLLAVITAITADVMPSYSAANPVSYVYSINLAISNASSINIVVSPTGTVNVAEFNELKERVDEISGGGGSGLTDNAKNALLACFRKVAWIDDQGQTYYDNLYDALYPSITSITAVFTQPGVIYDTQPLDALRQYLVVTAVYDDGTTTRVNDYTLSGTLTAGTSTITVTYQELTTTFNVTVTHNAARLTAVYTQTGTVYETDSLDSLKTDLVVTYYATQQSQGVILSDNDYTLSGTLAVGTSTITATYLNTSATFTVTVTFESYITAVYTSGQNPLYEDDNHTLNDLKSNLVVTAYTETDPQGVVLSDNDYTLSGALNRGNNTITATYNGMTATFTAVIVGVGSTNYSGALSTWWLPSNIGTATYSDGEITMYFAEGDTKYGMSIADNAQTLWSEVEGKKLRHRVTAYSPDWTGEYSSQVPRNMISFMACLYGSKTMTNYERLRFRTPYTDILTHNESVYEYISNCTLSWFNSGSGAVTQNTSYGIGMTDASTHTIKVTGSETVEVIPSSISAVFNQGANVIYTSDSLDDLKRFLTVTATYFDNSTLENKNYTLSGTLTAGVSTVAVSYQGLTATFTVNVTNVASGYIEAVFTQPSTTIYTDDALDTLKSDLVVTYYTAPGATGTVLADSAYTLSGTLTEGTSTITVKYQGLTDTFNVTVTGLVTVTASDIESHYGLQDFNVSNGDITFSNGPSSGYGACLFKSRVVRAEFKMVSAYDNDPSRPKPERFWWIIFGANGNILYACDYYHLYQFTYDASQGKYTATRDDTLGTYEFNNIGTFAENALCTASLINGVLTIRNEDGGMIRITNASRIGFWSDAFRSATWNDVMVNP